MKVIICDHKHAGIDILTVKRFDSPVTTVEAWQRDTIHYAVHGTLPAVTWKVASDDDIVKCLIEGAKLARSVRYTSPESADRKLAAIVGGES